MCGMKDKCIDCKWWSLPDSSEECLTCTGSDEPTPNWTKRDPLDKEERDPLSSAEDIRDGVTG